MNRIDVEIIAARKFVEIKGMEYLDSSKYTMSKNVTKMQLNNEIQFEFLIAKARPKKEGKIVVDETIPWDEVISICVNTVTGECRVE